MLQRGEIGSLQQRLVDVHRAAYLSLLAVQVAQDHLYFERLGFGASGVRQFLDRVVDLVVDQEIEAEHVVRGLAKSPAVDPAAVPQLVPFPRLAHHESQEQGKQHGEQVQLCCHEGQKFRCASFLRTSPFARGRAGARRPRPARRYPRRRSR